MFGIDVRGIHLRTSQFQRLNWGRAAPSARNNAVRPSARIEPVKHHYQHFGLAIGQIQRVGGGAQPLPRGSGAGRPQCQEQWILAIHKDRTGKTPLSNLWAGRWPDPTCGWRGPAPPKRVGRRGAHRSRTKMVCPPARFQSKNLQESNMWVEGPSPSRGMKSAGQPNPQGAWDGHPSPQRFQNRRTSTNSDTRLSNGPFGTNKLGNASLARIVLSSPN